jgi:hypothetical protein
MRIEAPRDNIPIVEGKRIALDWLKWFRRLYDLLGFNSEIPMYSDLSIGATQLPYADKGLSLATIDGNLEAVALPDSATTHLPFVLRLPSDYVDGGDLTPYAEWVSPVDDEGSVALEIGYSVSGAGDIAAESAVQSSTDRIEVSANEIVRTDFDDIDGSGFVRGDLIIGRITRLGTVTGDDFGNDVPLLSVGFKYPSAGIGWESKTP